MPSAAHIPGHPLHVVRRSVDGQPCFFTEHDRLCYLERLGKGLKAEACALHAYVLMSNHVHLLVTPSWRLSVVRLMNSLWCEAWSERFEARPVYPRRYVLACMRYIELNPVRARIALGAGDYRWSSYGANALGEDDLLLTPHGLYAALGRSSMERRAVYRRGFPDSYAPRTVSITRSGSGGAASARQATWPSGRTSTRRRS